MYNFIKISIAAALSGVFFSGYLFAEQVSILTTSGDRSLLLHEQTQDLPFTQPDIASGFRIDIDHDQTFQSVVGLGYALTQASAEAILSLSEAEQNSVLNEIFHPQAGNNVSMVRISIGASDLSTSLYTYSDETRSHQNFVPDPGKTYYIDMPAHNVRLGANGFDEDPYTAPNSPSGPDFEWRFVPAGEGLYFIDRAAGGPVPRLRTDDTNMADMQETSANGWWEKWELAPGEGHGAYFLSLPLKGFGNHDRLQIDDNLLVRMVDNDQSAGTWESFTFTEVGSDRSFSLQGPDTQTLLPVLKKVLAINPDIKVLATPWTAPLWMKTNNQWVGGELKPEHYGDLANYFVQYIQAMSAEGIDIWGVTPQNEPENPWNEPSMRMNAEQQFDLVENYLGPALQQAGLGHVKLLGFDHNLDHPEFPIRVAQSQYIDGSAFHLYAGEIDTMSQVFQATGKDVYFTEQWTGKPEDDTPEGWAAAFDGDLAFHMESVVMGSLRNHARSVLEWNLVTSPPTTATGCAACLGAITIESSGERVTRNVSYYIISQLSRYLQPGARRVVSTPYSEAILNVALKNPDGTLVAMVYNKSNSPQPVSVSWSEHAFEYTIPSRTAVTFRWQPETQAADEDGDTVPDQLDQCPGTPAGIEVDSSGCPIAGDDDLDGVWNDVDQCPQTPLNTPVDSNGCSLLDDDNDGIRNPFDACPQVVGPASNQGCPAESNLLRIEAEDWQEASGVQVESTTDSGGGMNVGWIDAGDWMTYIVTLPPSSTGNYEVRYRVASESSVGSLKLEQPGGAVEYGNLSFNATGGWQNWATVSHTVSLPANTSTLAITASTGGWNINWFEVKAVEDSVCDSDPSCLDDDNDGVPNSIDQCPATQPSAAVDSTGCAVTTSSQCDGVVAYPNWLHADYLEGPNTHLLGGDHMTYQGSLYQANWYTSSIPGSDNSWTLVGSCQ
ncbi:carbohydrate-binding protein [Microbulbifer salipaludis]|uniref:Carbohydrate-binding protein n=1 Tax=Microbulbifer salipaludis TaxID=187980 RepID=A0ABS3E708_9GAMM|nr:carbohydrate-binding protein [Microbulbifer salipaludis]MBN8430993.1 carbohydrate-binding protein [Microbulbifer salipaludis]